MREQCQTCKHAYGYEYLDGHPKVQSIECTLNPVWLEVSSQHFCSQYLGHYDTPAQVNTWSADPDETYREREKYKARAIKAEKAAKELRAKLREMKAGRVDA